MISNELFEKIQPNEKQLSKNAKLTLMIKLVDRHV